VSPHAHRPQNAAQDNIIIQAAASSGREKEIPILNEDSADEVENAA
jgi:hypothetical protein